MSILAFTSVVEIGTGLALMLEPALVVRLIFGVPVSGSGTYLARLFGVALLALGLACRPWTQNSAADSPASRAMLIYNALVALYLTYLGSVEHVAGVLLWPAVAVHTVVALAIGRAALARFSRT